MKAIITKYIPATNFKPGRVKATDGDNSVIVSCNDDNTHAAAAKALCKKLGWHGTLIEGCTKQGSVFVWSQGNRIKV